MGPGEIIGGILLGFVLFAPLVFLVLMVLNFMIKEMVDLWRKP